MPLGRSNLNCIFHRASVHLGIVLDSVIEDRLIAEDSRNSHDRGLVERLAANKRQLGQLLLKTSVKLSSDTEKKIRSSE